MLGAEKEQVMESLIEISIRGREEGAEGMVAAWTVGAARADDCLAELLADGSQKWKAMRKLNLMAQRVTQACDMTPTATDSKESPPKMQRLSKLLSGYNHVRNMTLSSLAVFRRPPNDFELNRLRCHASFESVAFGHPPSHTLTPW